MMRESIAAGDGDGDIMEVENVHRGFDHVEAVLHVRGQSVLLTSFPNLLRKSNRSNYYLAAPKSNRPAMAGIVRCRFWSS